MKDIQERTDSAEFLTLKAWAAEMADIPLKDIVRLSREEASTQNI